MGAGVVARWGASAVTAIPTRTTGGSPTAVPAAGAATECWPLPPLGPRMALALPAPRPVLLPAPRPVLLALLLARGAAEADRASADCMAALAANAGACRVAAGTRSPCEAAAAGAEAEASPTPVPPEGPRALASAASARGSAAAEPVSPSTGTAAATPAASATEVAMGLPPSFAGPMATSFVGERPVPARVALQGEGAPKGPWRLLPACPLLATAFEGESAVAPSRRMPMPASSAKGCCC
mmetsp:Transcript_11891/g.32619  ORF Transcript_11891/g.32619 Transcript_11891/m.32619 type:complete len:240 (+) Transcript_11891:828-1547(+)